jgi:hypothetical protein
MSCDNHPSNPTDLFRMVSSDEYAWTEASVQTEVRASRTTSITGQTSFDAFFSDKDMLTYILPNDEGNEDAHSADRLASIIMNDMLDAENAAQDPTNTLAPSSKSVGDGDPMFVSSPVHEDPLPPPPNEDAHSEDRLARLFENNMNRFFSINKKEMLVEDRPNDMLDACSTIAPSRTITMTVAPQVCLFVLRAHHVQAHAFLLTRAPLAG